MCATALGLAAGSRMAGTRRPDAAAHLADSIAGRLVHATPRQRRAIIREARTTAARDGVSVVIIDAGGGVAGRTRVVPRPLIAATRGGPGDSRIAVRSWGGAARVGVLAGPAASGGGPPLWLLGGGAALLVALLLGAVGLPPLRRPAAPRVRRTPPGTPAAVEAAVARYDPLTGLPNRMLLRETAESAIIRRRDSERVSLLLFDLDEFKEVNDNLGHFSGDSLLRALTARLEPEMPNGAMLARLGGDEFAVLAPVGLEGAGVIANAIGRLLERPFAIDGMMLQLDASIGVAVCPDHAPDFETLLKQADTAMYVAKRNRTGVEVHDVGREQQHTSRLALAADLRRGIEAGELTLEYQPQAELRGGICGVEALVRWEHPERGRIPPDQFIPLAERSGLIRLLTMWVLEQAVGQCKRWLDEDGIRLPVSVNLSTRDLIDADLPSQIARTIDCAGLDPSLLVVEITESVLMADPTRSQEIVSRIGDLGVAAAIDDFGSGYSSLAYLKRLPVQALKIDQAFVFNMTSDSQDMKIVQAIVDLAHNLGLRVIAEGVETLEAWERLGDLGCDEIQGFVLSRPRSSPDLVRWLRERERTAA